MKPEKKQEVVELAQYRKAQAARAAQEAERVRQMQQAKVEASERFLGNRPQAGLLLVVVILALAALFLLPKLSQFF